MYVIKTRVPVDSGRTPESFYTSDSDKNEVHAMKCAMENINFTW